MNNFQPDTLFMGKEAYFLDQNTSTNDWMWQFVKSRTPAEGALVVTEFQQHGKGRMSRSWESEAGKNILCSFYLKPAFLNIKHQAALNYAVALAVAQTFSHFITDQVFVKWPNDIISDNRKMAGILIENSIKGEKIEHVVVGIGMNINQKEFREDLRAASVIMLTGRFTPIAEVLAKLCVNLENQYQKLRNGKHAQILEAYNKNLYGKGEKVTIQTASSFSEGNVSQVNSEGEIEIVTSQGLIRYPFNNVKLFYNGFNS